jgi:hypothetical protein
MLNAIGKGYFGIERKPAAGNTAAADDSTLEDDLATLGKFT